jgi:hypothetical protein
MQDHQDINFSLAHKHAQRILQLLYNVSHSAVVVDVCAQLGTFNCLLRLLHIGNLEVRASTTSAHRHTYVFLHSRYCRLNVSA